MDPSQLEPKPELYTSEAPAMKYPDVLYTATIAMSLSSLLTTASSSSGVSEDVSWYKIILIRFAGQLTTFDFDYVIIGMFHISAFWVFLSLMLFRGLLCRWRNGRARCCGKTERRSQRYSCRGRSRPTLHQ